MTHVYPFKDEGSDRIRSQVFDKRAATEAPSTTGAGVSDGDKGDITVSASGATWTIDNGAVTLAKQADVATSTVFYRKTAGTGAPEVQTLATLKTDLGLTGTNSGDQTITLTGDVTGSGTGSFAATIASDAVTNAKLANMAASTIKARKTASTGDPEDCTLSEVLDFIGSAAQGDILYRGASAWARLAAGSSGQALVTGGAGANPSWSSVGAGSGGAMSTVGTSTISGAAATAFTALSGLSLSADGRYYFEIAAKNATGSSSQFDIEFNSDTTSTNYDRVYSVVTTTTTVSRGNDYFNGVMPASDTIYMIGYIGNDQEGKPTMMFWAREGSTTAVQLRHGFVKWRTASNVTSIRPAASVASSIAIGSTFKLWKIA